MVLENSGPRNQVARDAAVGGRQESQDDPGQLLHRLGGSVLRRAGGEDKDHVWRREENEGVLVNRCSAVNQRRSVSGVLAFTHYFSRFTIDSSALLAAIYCHYISRLQLGRVKITPPVNGSFADAKCPRIVALYTRLPPCCCCCY